MRLGQVVLQWRGVWPGGARAHRGTALSARAAEQCRAGAGGPFGEKSSSKTKLALKAKSSGKKKPVVKAEPTAGKRIKQPEHRLEEAVAVAESAATQTQRAAKRMAKQAKVVAEPSGKVARDVLPSGVEASADGSVVHGGVTWSV